MHWYPLTDPPDPPGGILEFDPPDERTSGLELHVYARDGATVVIWVTERGDLLAACRAAEA